MARISIRIPAELKAKMDACGENVNWSEIATEAIVKHLTEMKPPRKPRQTEFVRLLKLFGRINDRLSKGVGDRTVLMARRTVIGKAVVRNVTPEE